MKFNYTNIIDSPYTTFYKNDINYHQLFMRYGLYKYLEYIDKQIIPTSINILQFGLGYGLNLLYTIEQWDILLQKNNKWENTQLHFIIIENNLIQPKHILQYLSEYFPNLAKKLAEQLPPPINGFYKLCFNNVNVTIIVDELSNSLVQLHTKQNFFDLFYLPHDTYAINKKIFHQETTFKYLAKLAKPNSSLISTILDEITIKLLNNNNFLIQKDQQNNHLLSANYLPPNWQKEYFYKNLSPLKEHKKSAIIIGAGIAGANIANRLANYNIKVTIIDKGNIANGASGNPIGILKPNISSDDNLVSQLSRSSMHYANNFLKHNFHQKIWWQNINIQEQLRNKNNIHKLSNIENWLSINAQKDVLNWHKGIALQPKVFIKNLLNHNNIKIIEDRNITHFKINDNNLWQVFNHNNHIAQAELLIICNAFSVNELLDRNNQIPLKKVHGQISGIPRLDTYTKNLNKNLAYSGNGYLIKDLELANNYWCGATYEHKEPMSIHKAHEYNLNNLLILLPDLNINIKDTIYLWQHRLSTRAVMNNHLPIVGKIKNQNNAYIISGLSSHGLSWSGICAEIILAQICGGILPIGTSLFKAIKTS